MLCIAMYASRARSSETRSLMALCVLASSASRRRASARVRKASRFSSADAQQCKAGDIAHA